MFITLENVVEQIDKSIHSKDFGEAQSFLEDALDRFGDLEWLRYRACLLVESRDGQQAATPAWQKLVISFPNFFEARNRLAVNLAAIGDHSGAEEVIAAAEILAPNDVWVKSTWASIAEYRGDWGLAASRWREVRESCGDHLHAYEREIISLNESGQTAEAEILAAQFSRRWPESKAFLRFWADAPLLRLNRYAAAERWALVARARPAWREAVERAVEFYASAGCRRQALDLLFELINPENRDADFVRLVTNLALDEREIKTAISVISLAPSSIDSDGAARLICACDRSSDLDEVFNIIPEPVLEAITPEMLAIADVSARRASAWRAQMKRSATARRGERPSYPFEAEPPAPVRAQASEPPVETSVISFTDAMSGDGPHSELAANLFRLLRQLNDFVFDRQVRRYQWDLYTSGSLSLEDTGFSDWTLSGSVRLLHLSTALRLRRGMDTIWLISAGHGAGQELTMAFAPKFNLVFHLEAQEIETVNVALTILNDRSIYSLCPDYAEKLTGWRYIRRRLTQIFRPKFFGKLLSGDGAILLVGHNNYAHFFWNELSALCRTAEMSASPRTRSAILFEPFGHIDLPLPVTIEKLPPLDKFSPYACFYLSSLVITPQARAQAMEQSRAAFPEFRLPDTIGHTIWVSLRLMYRHPVNQVEYVKALIRRFAQSERLYTLILDGFSLPPDIGAPDRYDTSYLRMHADRVGVIAREIIDWPRPESVRVIDLTQLTVPESVLAGAVAQQYVCSQGTQQHKIGWLHDISGVIHTNHALAMASPSAEWVQCQASIGSEAVILAANYVQDIDSDNERQDWGREGFRDYAFVDVESAAQATFELLFDLERVETARQDLIEDLQKWAAET